MKINHGYLSIFIFNIALLMGAYSIAVESILLALLYLVVIVSLYISAAYFYCRSCPHAADDTCLHYFIGRLTKLMPEKKNKRITGRDMFFVLLPTSVLIVMPQFWLIRMVPLMVTFWILFLIAGIEIYTQVCKDCRNTECANCPNRA